MDLSNGLSAMGNAVSATAGNMAVEQQKQDLERQRDVLASQLAEGRETRLQTLRGQQASQLSTQQSQERTSEYGAQKATDIKMAPLIADAQDAIMEKRTSDPNWIQAQKTYVSATATAKDRAEAALAMAQSVQVGLQTKAAQAVLDARTDLKQAVASGDQDGIQKAQQAVAVAEYNTKDEVQRAAALAAQERNDQQYVTSLEGQITAKSVAPIGEQPAQAAQREKLINDLQDQLKVARDNYEISHGMAVKAARDVPAVDFGSASKGSRPPLASFYKGAPQTPGGSLGAPDMSNPGATGLLNTP